MKRIACSGIGIVLSLGLLGLPAGAQGQTQSNTQSSSSEGSLGDYARQVRKNPGAPAKPKVYDNDNLPTNQKLSIVGQASDTSADNSTSTENKPAEQSGPAQAGPAQSGAAPQGGGEVKVQVEAKTPDSKAQPSVAATAAADQAAKDAAVKQWGDKINAQKEQIDLLTRELNVLQREYQIRAAAMYGDVGNRMRNSSDWDKQDTQYKQQIAEKQKALDDAKQALDDMTEAARKAGVPASVREP